jgi:hypothetical protein
MIKNRINVGMPMWNDVLLDTMLRKSSIEPMSSIFSGVNDMVSCPNNIVKNRESISAAALTIELIFETEVPAMA